MEYANIFLLSLPEGLSCMLATLMLLEDRLGRHCSRLLLFAFIYAPFCEITAYWAFNHPQFFIARQIIYAIVAVLLCRLLLASDWSRAVLTASLFIVIISLSSPVQFGMEQLFTGHTTHFYDTPQSYLPRYWWPVDMAVIVIAALLRKASLRKWLNRLSDYGAEKNALIVALIILTQFSIVTGSLMQVSTIGQLLGTDYAIEYMGIAASFLIFFVLSLVIMGYSIGLARDVTLQNLEGRLAERIASLNWGLRANRHDFIQHVQTLQILYQEGQKAEFKAYLDQVESQVQETIGESSGSEAMLRDLLPNDLRGSAVIIKRQGL